MFIRGGSEDAVRRESLERRRLLAERSKDLRFPLYRTHPGAAAFHLSAAALA
jgi:hypothetical protein